MAASWGTFWKILRDNPKLCEHNDKLHAGKYPPRPGTINVRHVLDSLFEAIPLPLILKYFSRRVWQIETIGNWELNQQLAWEIFTDMHDHILMPATRSPRPEPAQEKYIEGCKK